MFTLVIVFVCFALMVPLAIGAQRWLFTETSEVYDPESALYEQRYD